MVKFQNTTKLRVRYGETDQMGIVHHSEYINYLEIARIDDDETCDLAGWAILDCCESHRSSRSLVLGDGCDG